MINKAYLKIIPIFLSISLIVPSINAYADVVTNGANSNVKATSVIAVNNRLKGLKYSITKNKDNLEDTVFTYSNGEVQTLQEKKINGKIQCIAKSKGKTVVIQKGNDGDIYIDGIKQNNINKTVENKLPNTVASSNSLSAINLNAASIPGWTYAGTQKWSTALDAGNIAFSVGVIVGILGAPITGFVTSVVSFLVSQGMDTVWYLKNQYFANGNFTHVREYDVFYKYSNYTGYINQTYWEFYSERPPVVLK